jgi:hypothetical protein
MPELLRGLGVAVQGTSSGLGGLSETTLLLTALPTFPAPRTPRMAVVGSGLTIEAAAAVEDGGHEQRVARRGDGIR